MHRLFHEDGTSNIYMPIVSQVWLRAYVRDHYKFLRPKQFEQTVCRLCVNHTLSLVVAGAGNALCYYGQKLEERSVLELVRSKPFLLAMADTDGTTTNTTQFLFTTYTMHWLSDRHIAFGEVLEGQVCAFWHKLFLSSVWLKVQLCYVKYSCPM